MAKFEIYEVSEVDGDEPGYRWRLVSDQGVVVARDGHFMSALSVPESKLRARHAALAMQTADIVTELIPADRIGEVEEEALRNDR